MEDVLLYGINKHLKNQTIVLYAFRLTSLEELREFVHSTICKRYRAGIESSWLYGHYTRFVSNPAEFRPVRILIHVEARGTSNLQLNYHDSSLVTGNELPYSYLETEYLNSL